MTFSLRRLTITVIFVLIISAVTVAGVFLSIFDLNHFRGQISDTISSRLSQPVDFGEAHFSIKHGPSFAFNKIQVGTRSGPLYLTASKIFFRLEVLPLLIGQYKFSEILFEEPDVTLRVGQNSSSGTGSGRRLVVDQSLFSGDLIRSIRVQNGHVRLEDHRNAKTPFVAALKNLRMVVDDLSLRQSGWVEMQADIHFNKIHSPFSLSGFINAGNSAPFWNHASYNLKLELNDFASDILSSRYQKLFSRFRVEGRSDINIRVSGSPAEGLNFNSVFTGRDLGIRFPGTQHPVPANKIAFSGDWMNVGKHHTLENLRLEFGSMHLFGRVSLDRSMQDPRIKTSIRAPRIALTDLNRFIGLNREKADTPKKIELTAGTLKLDKFEIDAPLSRLSGPNLLKAIKTLDLDILQGEFSYGENSSFTNLNMALEWDKQIIRLKHLSADSHDVQFLSDGVINIEPGEKDEEIALTGQWGLNLNNIERTLSNKRPLLPEQGLKAMLYVNSKFSEGAWTLKDNLLALPSIKMLLNGKWDLLTDKKYHLDGTIPEFLLNDLPLISPAIAAIKPEGKVSAKVRLSGSREAAVQLQGKMFLDEAYLHIAGPLADLSKMSGTVELKWPKLSGENLVANLGESPIQLGIEIPNLASPRVNLAIKGESIRADELIFRSEKTFLRDVDARLSITDRALLLGPIQTRMDGGTDVTINGTVDNFPTADTRLTIEGSYGNIDEVIGLWLSDQYRPTHKKKRKPGLLEIDIKTDAGEIANLPFESCEAHISFRDRTLIIHPITFKSGPGFGIGQVLVVYRDNLPPLLKMSGHLEDFDALAVYQQLLQRKGIVTGRLRGDFYLEGTAGNLKEVFLPSSAGSFNFNINDGVLKKLRGLSKTLTLFNIYPIFTSSGSSKGVPFKKLTGNARIEQGILKSDNMLMKGDVMNMSMTGQQNLITTEVDIELGVMPLRTIDRLITKIPLAGWILAGDNKALVTAHFKLTGSGDDPTVTAIPVESASKQVLGIFERIFTLPVKIISDAGKVLN